MKNHLLENEAVAVAVDVVEDRVEFRDVDDESRYIYPDLACDVEVEHFSVPASYEAASWDRVIDGGATVANTKIAIDIGSVTLVRGDHGFARVKLAPAVKLNLQEWSIFQRVFARKHQRSHTKTCCQGLSHTR